MISIDSCPVCNNNSSKLFIQCKDHLVSKGLFEIRSCTKCGFKFTSPRPSQNELGAYYQSTDYISHNEDQRGIVASIYRLVRNFAIRAKERILSDKVSRGTLLDYGCGTGNFLNYCREKKWNVLGIETDSGARETSISKNISVYANQNQLAASLPDLKFDAITMWHVLEHIDDLKGCMGFLRERLKSNGILVIAVPNYKSYDANLYKNHWAAYDLPRHLSHFDKTSLTYLLKQNGFNLEAIKPMYFDSFYVSLLSESNAKRKMSYLKAFFNGLSSNLKASFNGEYSSLIYIAKKSIEANP